MSVDEFLKHLGRAIRARREAMGISQEAFGDRIEVNRVYYGDLERGARNPTILSLDKVAKGLGTTMATLFVEAEAGTAGSAARRSSRKT